MITACGFQTAVLPMAARTAGAMALMPAAMGTPVLPAGVARQVAAGGTARMHAAIEADTARQMAAGYVHT